MHLISEMLAFNHSKRQQKIVRRRQLFFQFEHTHTHTTKSLKSKPTLSQLKKKIAIHFRLPGPFFLLNIRVRYINFFEVRRARLMCSPSFNSQNTHFG
jgi:hypothetical protein